MLTPWLFACAVSLTACAGLASDSDEATARRDQAVEALQAQTGAPVTVEVNAAGTTRVVHLTPRFTAPTRESSPAVAAARFLTSNHDAFQISAEDAASFVATRVDPELERNITHITLQRTVAGVPVFQGGIQVALDNGNNVVRVTADELYKVGAPTNRMLLSPAQAAEAAARQLGVSIKLGQATVDGQATSFDAAGTSDPVKVEPRIFQVAPGDDRLAHQVLLAWNDEHKQAQYQLVLIDAETGAQLFSDTLVNAISGRVFSAGNQPAPSDTTDHRTVVSFDGNATASPNGWVTAPANKTIGNNAVAATDLNGNNTVGTNEVQPTATNGTFDFPYSPATDSASEAAAAVTNAFFYVNDHHDRTYALGFTEAAGNFQTSNFGRGGAQNDPVNVDAQDGSGTNNANFSTPPDGSRPRMQMFLFNIIHGSTGRPRQDGDFDGTVVYHENTHGLSNRLVGGGATTCLNHLQSGGMGEGWSDFIAGSFLNNPVIGAYVTGNTVTGIRQQSMGNSKWTFNDLKNGTLAEVHDVGELWSAALWDVRKAVGQATAERIVVQGMKNTPCHPTMLQARDGIIAADQTLNGGANKCAIWHAFAGRLMGTGATSASDSSTSGVTTSTAVPAGC
ncbi:MAG TPA: M36 family metallopeptidase [Kofleriaceae bacterium]|nr:M36 family metallopeptidase [Kofleriaceae bacterium]